jgi:hypothetical protein
MSLHSGSPWRNRLESAEAHVLIGACPHSFDFPDECALVSVSERLC